MNPLAKVQRPKRQVNNAGEKALNVEQVVGLLQGAVKNNFRQECAALVLTLFCGVRVDRLTWEKIKLDENTPVVVLDQTRANRRRINAIPQNALRWLKGLRSTGRVTADNHEGRMRWLRKASKIEYRQNAARVCFASFHVAMHEDPAKTSLLLGLIRHLPRLRSKPKFVAC